MAVSSIREACGYFKSPELNNKVPICSLAQQDMEQAYLVQKHSEIRLVKKKNTGVRSVCRTDARPRQEW